MTIVAFEDSEIEKLQRQIAELTAAVEARDTFISITAHELRNPMMPITGQIELLLHWVRTGRYPLSQLERRLERLQYATCHYMKRASILLDVSHIISGKLQLELEPSDLAVLLRVFVGEHARSAWHMSVPVTVAAPESLPGTWDRLAIEQILDNLLSNAIKHGAHTPVELSAAMHGEQVRIQVRDHGGGIPLAQRARVFECFERAVGPGGQRSGFGIGLWVVRQLVEAMGGTVAIEDALGGGALFTVDLPRHAKEAHL